MGLEQVLVSSIGYLIVKKLFLTKKRYNLAFFAMFVYLYYLANGHFQSHVPNVYEALGISRAWSSEEVKDSYKRMLKFKHPDKVQSPTAEKDFREYKELYDYIKSPESRLKYECFGKQTKSESVYSSAGFYTSWIFVANGLFLSKISNSGRSLLCIISGIGVFEASVFPMLVSSGVFWPRFTVFEVLEFIKALVPAVCLFLNSYEYIKLQENEEMFESKFNELVSYKAKEIIERIITKTSPPDIFDFISQAQKDFESKYAPNRKRDYIPFLLLAYLIFR